MAIKLIENGAISASYKNTPKNKTVNEGSDFTQVLSEAKTVVRNDSVVITNTVMGIKKSFESSTESNVDAARLARIKHAIESGTYEINPDRIAAKMIQFGY
ncbi:MAG: flagellar biosynthesis anti-sigma factor FlgM [Methylococcaceae bacterium]|jgi:flagellar biosynthesis anti-sigma factor FlgM